MVPDDSDLNNRETKKTITKKNIVKAISNEIGLTQKVTKEIVEKVFSSIVDTLITSKRLELRNFGVFEVKKRAARMGRNPKTSKEVPIPEKYVVTFKPGKEMEERIQRLMKEQELNEDSDATGDVLPDRKNEDG